MIKKNVIFSYLNILKRQIEKKKYLSFVRKIFNLIFKIFINSIKRKLNFIINLDKQDNTKIYNYSLEKLFNHFNCDKGTILKYNNIIIKTHNYTPYYEKYFKNIKNNKIRILELGSHEGKGLAAFYYFFPKSSLFGANINPFQMRFQSNRIEEIYIDVSSKIILKNFCKYFEDGFDIIIDDASHNLHDILLTLPLLFKKLNRGGFYVIEDANQFEVYKNLNPTNETLTPIKILKNIQQKKEFNSQFISADDVSYLRNNIAEYFFEKGDMIVNDHKISDIIFLKKNG
tara:strand:- start:609 stop:1466 length:858 start_codon:yes stop_codon:yes gene_type:complete